MCKFEFKTIENVKSLQNIKTLPNSSVVALYSERESANGIGTKWELFAVDGVKSTKGVDIVTPLLLSFLADFKDCEQFNSAFGVISYEDENQQTTSVKSNLRKVSRLKKFLKTNTIYKTDSEGKITTALICEEGVNLGKTALRIKSKDDIATSKGKRLRAGIFNQAKAIVAQTNSTKSFIEIMNNVFNEFDKAKEEERKEEQTKAKAKAKAKAKTSVA